MEAIISIIKTTSLVAEKGTHFSSAASLLLLLLLLFTFSLILRQKKKKTTCFSYRPFPYSLLEMVFLLRGEREAICFVTDKGYSKA